MESPAKLADRHSGDRDRRAVGREAHTAVQIEVPEGRGQASRKADHSATPRATFLEIGSAHGAAEDPEVGRPGVRSDPHRGLAGDAEVARGQRGFGFGTEPSTRSPVEGINPPDQGYGSVGPPRAETAVRHPAEPAIDSVLPDLPRERQFGANEFPPSVRGSILCRTGHPASESDAEVRVRGDLNCDGATAEAVVHRNVTRGFLPQGAGSVQLPGEPKRGRLPAEAGGGRDQTVFLFLAILGRFGLQPDEVIRDLVPDVRTPPGLAGDARTELEVVTPGLLASPDEDAVIPVGRDAFRRDRVQDHRARAGVEDRSPEAPNRRNAETLSFQMDLIGIHRHHELLTERFPRFHLEQGVGIPPARRLEGCRAGRRHAGQSHQRRAERGEGDEDHFVKVQAGHVGPPFTERGFVAPHSA